MSGPVPAAAPLARTIPGFSLPTPSAPKPRKRSAKKAPSAPVEPSTSTSSAIGGGRETTTTIDAPDAPDADVDAESLVKRTNAVEQTKKRLRAQNKKLQRLDAYEAKADINEDQRRALAGRATIDAVVKELNELLVILQAEEVEDAEREKRVIAAEEKKHARAVEAAVKASKADSQSHIVLLCQFLHLRSLFSPNDSASAFAPPVLPPVVANATGQEVAAVHALFDAFSNGPLLGGHGDALDQLDKIAAGSSEHVLEGVTYSRIQELVHGLTAPPPPAAAGLDDSNDTTRLDSPVVESSAAPGPTDSVVALVDGDKEDKAPSFLNESELAPPTTPGVAAKVASWADEIADNAQVPPSGPATPTADVLSFVTNGAGGAVTPTSSTTTPAAPGGGGETTPVLLSAVTPPAAVTAEPKLDWSTSTEDDEGGLPHLPELAPAVPIVGHHEQQQAAPPQAQALAQGEGFPPSTTTTRAPRRGGQGYRGGAGGDRDDNNNNNPHHHHQGPRRGSFRGGRGEGRGGRGNGGGRGARGGRGRGGPAPSPAAAAPSPSA
ncbi:hypothetical protein JCM11491_004883 [Sporobolomyces phaffii]